MPPQFYRARPKLGSFEVKKINGHTIQISNQSGFIVADFLFSFILVLSCGILIFGFTFSLATVEIAQYIVWSTARNFSAANSSESNAKIQATKKFNNLADKFPLISGRGASSTPWFTMSAPILGNLATADTDLSAQLGADKLNRDSSLQIRQPWIGAKSDLELKLLSGFKFPFLGPIVPDKTGFTFPIRAFVLRHPSQTECYNFFAMERRYREGILLLNQTEGNLFTFPNVNPGKYVPIEDNGC